MSSAESKQIPARILPTMATDSQVVRCVCPLRLPSGPMVKCTRCGCLSHKKCVKYTDPFICEFCHHAAQRILEANFDSMVTPTGNTIQLFALKDALLNEFSVLEVCEIRDHCVSAGQVGTLLDHLMIYFSSLEADLEHVEQFSLSVIPDELKQQVHDEVNTKRMFFRAACEKAAKLKDIWDGSKKSLTVLTYFRDAVIKTLT